MFTLPSFAKINLMLRVLGRRPDGFHEIFTVFQTVSLHDDLTFVAGDKLELTCSNKSIPTDEKNLVIKAAKMLSERAAPNSGASIHLKKRIPSPGGLGGGSSNAAVALIGLMKLWELYVPLDELHRMASKLGSDVPFFLSGGTARGAGTGTSLEPAHDVYAPLLLIVTPAASVSTAAAYAQLQAENLTSPDAERMLSVCRSEAESLDIGHSELRNDMEAAVFAAYPEIERVKKRLIELGAVNALMSGSGASVFGVFDKEETRQTALKALDEQVNWRKFAVAAVSRKEYRERVYGGL